MKISLSVIAAIVLSIFVWSCQSDPDEVPPPPPPPLPPAVNDSFYVKIVANLDTTFTSGLDTTLKVIIDYDAQKRAERIRIYYYNAGTPGSNVMDDEKRYYNGNDTVPYKIAVYNYDFPTPAEIDTTFLSYQDGIVTRDSTREYSSNTLQEVKVTNYKKINATTFSAEVVRRDPTGIITYRDSALSKQVWLNGNMISRIDSVFSGSYYTVADQQYQYDNKPNPFARVTLPYPINSYAFDMGSSLTSFIKNLNNETDYISKERRDLGSPNYYHAKTYYSYRTDNYPVVMWQVEDNGDRYKTVFAYTRL